LIDIRIEFKAGLAPQRTIELFYLWSDRVERAKGGVWFPDTHKIPVGITERAED